METIKEQHYVFQLDKTRIYEVEIEPLIYYIAPKFNEPIQDGYDFTHSAAVFNRPKTDFKVCGQCQNDVTKDFPVAREFCEKWDDNHLHKMTEELYKEFKKDILALCEAYNYLKSDNPITFWEKRDISKMKVGKTKK